mmetsp:Transcript_84722/g.165784  ORF Transcript_84722/g.165784 Transcript_84722/m.165784 type:complete len:267 (-) Transcript_84722:67-867(-)
MAFAAALEEQILEELQQRLYRWQQPPSPANRLGAPPARPPVQPASRAPVADALLLHPLLLPSLLTSVPPGLGDPRAAPGTKADCGERPTLVRSAKKCACGGGAVAAVPAAADLDDGGSTVGSSPHSRRSGAESSPVRIRLEDTFHAGAHADAALDPWPLVPAPARVVNLASLVDSQPSPGAEPARKVGTPECPSAGSVGHSFGLCKPCDFVSRGFCRAGATCRFCHLCGPLERKKWKQEQKRLAKAMARGQLDVHPQTHRGRCVTV